MLRIKSTVVLFNMTAKILYLYDNRRQIRGLRMEGKEVAGRSVAVAIGIVCIILEVSLVRAVANYTLLMNDKDNTLSSLQTPNNSLNSRISSIQNRIASQHANSACARGR